MANPPPLPPGIGFMPDSSVNLWRKIARNFYTKAVAAGYTGNNPPTPLDNKISSIRKSVSYTYYLASLIT